MASQCQGREPIDPGRTELLTADAALVGLEGDPEHPQFQARLRRVCTPAIARLAADLARARKRASGRHLLGALGFFTSRGLEQATPTEVARARAGRFAAEGGGRDVLDATCGIGADSLALAGAGLRVVSADRDALLAACTHENLLRSGLPARVVVADALAPPARAGLCVLDPDRRATGRRSLDPADWSPTLGQALRLAGRFEGSCIKLAPGLDPEEVGLTGAGGRLQWVSLDGELRELALWTGVLDAEPGSSQREVLGLWACGRSERLQGMPREVPPLSLEAARSIPYLIDPDPAVVRSGLLGLLAEREGLAPLAARLAYLGGERPPTSAFLRGFRVLESCACDARQVRRMLARHDVGPVEVRKRGHPEPAEVLARRFQGSGRIRGRLAVARLDRGHAVYLLEPASPPRETGARPPGVGDEGIEPPTSSL
jgi:hypothetical protein